VEVGRHGVLARFYGDEGLVGSATFLPDVVVEQRWSREDLMVNLERKAGVGKFDRVELVRYEARTSLPLSYSDYIKLYHRDGLI
jgi:AMMECR1 domain-containing protein